MLSVTELMNVLTLDDINIIKKNLLHPFSNEEIVNLYLEKKYWNNFRKKIVLKELQGFQIKADSKENRSKGKSVKKNVNIVQELNYFKNQGTFKLDCKSIFNPVILKH